MTRSLLLTLALVGCSQPAPSINVTNQAPNAARSSAGGTFVALPILATTEDGVAIPCHQGDLTVTVTVDGGDGHFATIPPQTYRVACDDGRKGDVAIVVDNSGSVSGHLTNLKAGASALAERVLAHDGRASLARVSTNASLEVPLTDDAFSLQNGIDGMFINRGWTALYDGMRMGHETLGAGALADNGAPTYDDLDTFCGTRRTHGVVTFTDGQENNSAEQMAAEYDLDRYPGDGIDTTYDAIAALNLSGVSTPLYNIGMGNAIDADSLRSLSEVTGGRFMEIQNASEIEGVFDLIGDYFDAQHQVCVDLPALECGEFTLRVTYDWTYEDRHVQGTIEEPFGVPCAEPPDGRVVTILLTTGDPNFPTTLSQQLAVNVVEWVSPVLRANVLVVLDALHMGEDEGDAQLVSFLLSDEDTLSVSYIDEPEGGLGESDIEGYDVVWFSNPGHPFGTFKSFQTLETAIARGKGVVLQGDDMTWSLGHAFSMSPLTRLDHVDNGTEACGTKIDDNKHGHYVVTLGDQDHPVLNGLNGESFLYGNDIDLSYARGEGEVVLATASVDGNPACPPRPVIVGYDPTP